MASDLGIPSGEVLRRTEAQAAAQPAIIAIRADPTEFGGAIFDDADGWWRLHIFYVGENAGGARVRELLPPGLPVEWTAVKRSYAELVDIEAQLVRLTNDSVDQGGGPLFSSSGIDERRSQVYAALPAHDPALEAKLTQQFGDAVYIVIRPFANPLH